MSCELIKSMIDYNDVMRHNYKFQLLKEFGFLISTKEIGGIHILVLVCYDSKKWLDLVERNFNFNIEKN
jgi:hypothetical protein